MPNKKYNTIIYAIDSATENEIQNQLDMYNNLNEEKKKYVYALKIGLLSIMKNGVSIIKKIKVNSDLPIICDLKLADIPDISKEIAKIVYEAGVFGIVVHGFVGEQVINELLRIDDLYLFLITEMSHDNRKFKGLTHINSKKLIDIALKCNVYAIHYPGKNYKEIRVIKNLLRRTNRSIKIAATGIGYPQIADPIRALIDGEDYLIVVRDFINVIEKISNPRSYEMQYSFMERVNIIPYIKTIVSFMPDVIKLILKYILRG